PSRVDARDAPPDAWAAGAESRAAPCRGFAASSRGHRRGAYRDPVGHAEHLAGRRARGNRTEKKGTLPREHCCGGKIRTSGLWVMSPTSYRCSTPHDHLTPTVALQRSPKKNAIHRCSLDGPLLTTAADGPLACPSRCTCTSASFGPTIP